MNRQRCGIIGCGVVGNILASHLSNVGREVYMVDILQDVVDSINAGGVHVRGAIDCHSRVAKAFTSIEEMQLLNPAFVFVCVKTPSLPQVLPKLKAFDNGKTYFISVQNGIETEDEFLGYIPKERIFRIVVNYAGERIKPGHVKSTFFHPPNYIGGVCAEGADFAREVADLMTQAGLHTEYAADIKTKVWRKAILNSCLIPTSVITRLNMKHLMELEDTRYIVESQIQHFLKVAAAEGHVFEDDFVESAIEYLTNTGGHKPSTLVDYETGQPIELDFLNVKIQHYADKHGIKCEENRVIISLIKGMLRERELRKEMEIKEGKGNSSGLGEDEGSGDMEASEGL